MTNKTNLAAPSVFQIPPPGRCRRIPMKTIQAVARHITGKLDPDQIVLFGPCASGNPMPWSDVALLVVMDTPKGKEFGT